jgi:hypothetical protein
MWPEQFAPMPDCILSAEVTAIRGTVASHRFECWLAPIGDGDLKRQCVRDSGTPARHAIFDSDPHSFVAEAEFLSIVPGLHLTPFDDGVHLHFIPSPIGVN